MQLSRNSKISLAAFGVFDLLLAYWLITLFQARDQIEAKLLERFGPPTEQA